MGGGMGHGVASDEAIFALDANMVLVVEHRPGARGGRKPLIRRRDLIANLAQIWESLDRRVTTSQHSDFAAFCELVCEGIGWPTEGLVSALPDAVRHWRNLPGKIHR
jgi:hypothetical protein